MPTYQETLDFLYSQLPMFQRVGGPAYKKGLGNTRALLNALGNPQDQFPCIHIAGTNGKGTVSHMLAACLTAAGFRTGLYVSPHYRDFRERMKINGQLIPRSDVVDLVAHMRPVINDVKPSFFEMTVALAFAAFARHQVDIAVIETGLGGRLDSTNVVRPLLSVITNISFDHMSMLGNTLPKIAREKAGIIKKQTPVVIGEYQHTVADVFRSTASRRLAPLTFADRRLKARIVKDGWEHQVYDIIDTKGAIQYRGLKLGCSGPFQAANLVTTLHALHVLGTVSPQFDLTERHIRKGLLHIRSLTAYLGRWQILGKAPVLLADSGHNPAGLALTMKKLRALKYNNLHFVIGCVNDKDLDPMLTVLPVEATYYFCRPDIPRGLNAVELHAVAELYGLKGAHYQSVRQAVRAARRAAGSRDLIFIGGSTFVVAEVI